MSFIKTTEEPSNYRHLEQMSTNQLLTNINQEDQKVAIAVQKCIPAIETLVDQISDRMLSGGRLFYLGAGTSGRLGVVDASECPPTFGVDHGLVNGIMAGGDGAMRKAVEFAEDDPQQGWKDLEFYNINSIDIVVGIAASGTTPYVIGALKKCQKQHIPTACISCNVGSPLAAVSDFPIEVVVGPEVVTGSSRMKAGTAQKLILNMITTSAMIQLGRIKDNKMVDMQLSNHKLVDRGIRMLINELNISKAEAKKLLETHQNVRAAINAHKHG